MATIDFEDKRRLLDELDQAKDVDALREVIRKVIEQIPEKDYNPYD